MRSTGELACWGGIYNRISCIQGQPCPPSYANLAPPPGTFRQATCEVAHCCAVRTDGALSCWGSDDWPLAKNPPAGAYRQVSLLTQGGSYAVRNDGNLVRWGGGGGAFGSLRPGTFRQVSAGRFNYCAIATDGTLACGGFEEWAGITPPAGTFW